MTISRPPVTDWKTDFDHLDPAWVADPYPIWDELRKECPIPHTERYTGAYLATRYSDVREIAYDTENFTSKYINLRVERPNPPVESPPLSFDPPEHRTYRMPIMSLFTPDAIKVLESDVVSICDKLIDAFIDKGKCDAAEEYAQEITSRVMARFLGVPEEMGPQFRHWIHQNFEKGLVDPESYARSVAEIEAFFTREVEKRREKPTDDLITYIMTVNYKNQGVMSQEMVVATLRFLMFAGVDTTWSIIGASIWHLSKNPKDLARLVAEPQLLPSAIEEFLRAFAPASLARTVKNDVEIGGCPMKAGEMVLLLYPSANRDPVAFPDPEKVVLDREVNKHMAFGIGIHKCLGEHLARLEIRVALQRFLARIPNFTIDESKEVTWSASHVRGIRTAPIKF